MDNTKVPIDQNPMISVTNPSVPHNRHKSIYLGIIGILLLLTGSGIGYYLGLDNHTGANSFNNQVLPTFKPERTKISPTTTDKSMNDCIPSNKLIPEYQNEDDPTIQSSVPIVTICFDSPPDVGKSVGVTLTILPRLESSNTPAAISFNLSSGFSLEKGELNTTEMFSRGVLIKRHIVVIPNTKGIMALSGCVQQYSYKDTIVTKHCDMAAGKLVNNKIQVKRLTLKEFRDIGGI